MDLFRGKVDSEADSGEGSQNDAASFAVFAELLVSLGSLDGIGDGGLVKVDGFRWRSDGRILLSKWPSITGFAAALCGCILAPLHGARECSALTPGQLKGKR